MVQDTRGWFLTLEDSTEQYFEPVPFRFIPPASGKDGFQEMTLAIDNVDRKISDFIEKIGVESREPVKIYYRPYLSNDTSGPKLNPPLVLNLVDIKINVFEATGRASFTGIINTRYPSELYTRDRFPSLGN